MYLNPKFSPQIVITDVVWCMQMLAVSAAIPGLNENCTTFSSRTRVTALHLTDGFFTAPSAKGDFDSLISIFIFYVNLFKS